MDSVPASRSAGVITKRDGGTPYEVRGREGGKYGHQYRRRFRTLKEARDFELGMAMREARRKNGLPAEREDVSYDELVRRFLAQYDAASKAWKADMLDYSVQRFGAVLVRDLRPDQISAWLQTLPYRPKTRQHILDAMRQVLGTGVEWGYLDRNPARSRAVRGPRQGESDVRPFRSWSEVEIVAACAGDYGPLIVFACATGLRPEEWIPLQWQDLDLRSGFLSVNKVCVDGVISTERGKSDAAFRTVLLADRAQDALASLPRPIRSNRLVFPAPRGGLIDLDNWRARQWRDAISLSELAPRPPYQMRHTYASLSLAAGADIYWVSKQMGHKDISVTLKHYARFARGSAVDERNRLLLNDFGRASSEGVSEVRHKEITPEQPIT
jgi:integrase